MTLVRTDLTLKNLKGVNLFTKPEPYSQSVSIENPKNLCQEINVKKVMKIMDNRGLPPDQLKELRRQRRIEKKQTQLQMERERRQLKREANAGRDKEKALAELMAINNEITKLTPVNQKNKDRTASKDSLTIGKSENNKKWEQKRVQRYNERVWKGWRENDGQEAPVKIYKLDELDK